MIENSEQLSIISKENDELQSDSFVSSFIGNLVSGGSFSPLSLSQGESIVVKSAVQDYQGMLQVLDREFEESSVQQTNSLLTTAKGSLVDGCKKSEFFNQEIFHHNAFAVPGKFLCKNCGQETTSIIKFLPLKSNFWLSLKDFFKPSKCCSEKSHQPDILHECPNCSYLLARISSI
jgi:hypothetical protein